MDWLIPSQAVRTLGELEALLKREGIQPNPGSPFDDLAFAIVELSYGRQFSAKDYSTDVRLLYRRLLGLAEFAGVLLKVSQHGEFPKLIPHLRLLAKGDPSATLPTTGRDTASHKLLELYIAALCLRCGLDLELDDPEHSVGDNPDVIVTMGGQRWGFACKSPQTRSPQTWADHIDKGVQQIERAPCDRGAVVFAGRAVVKHEDLWPLRNPSDAAAGKEPLFGAFAEFAAAKAAAVHDVQVLGKSVLDDIGAAALASLYAGTKSFPGILIAVHCVALVATRPRPIPASLRFMNLQYLRSPTVEETAVFDCLNRAADDWKQ